MMLSSIASKKQIFSEMAQRKVSCRYPKMIQRRCGTQFKNVCPTTPISCLQSYHSVHSLTANLADDFNTFNAISKRLLHSQGAPLRHIPLKIYLPSSPSASEPTSGHLRVVQSLVTPNLPNSREVQTLGTTLHSLLPTLFPSRRTPILAKAILHGAVVPLAVPVEDLMRTAAYLDGWVHLRVAMIG